MPSKRPALRDLGQELFGGKVKCRKCGKWCTSWVQIPAGAVFSQPLIKEDFDKAVVDATLDLLADDIIDRRSRP
jgi:hypothetical protein